MAGQTKQTHLPTCIHLFMVATLSEIVAAKRISVPTQYVILLKCSMYEVSFGAFSGASFFVHAWSKNSSILMVEKSLCSINVNCTAISPAAKSRNSDRFEDFLKKLKELPPFLSLLFFESSFLYDCCGCYFSLLEKNKIVRLLFYHCLLLLQFNSHFAFQFGVISCFYPRLQFLFHLRRDRA